MSRVKRGTIANKKRRKILKAVKGFTWGRKSKERAAKEALLHALPRSFRGRKEKKRTMRTLWTIKLNAALRPEITYSKFIAALYAKNVKLDRKVLANIAEFEPKVFAKVKEFVMSVGSSK
jgi:large subunit ribosomal protein L20